jgi:hypothetical protein
MDMKIPAERHLLLDASSMATGRCQLEQQILLP